jgi:PHD/YefM family antitoxin component YafN of YafNO toxin-antitoxin module
MCPDADVASLATPNPDPQGEQQAMAEVLVRDNELFTIREAMRELNRMVDQLESGELEKLVLTQRNRLRAVVLSAEAFSAIQQRLDGQLAADESTSPHQARAARESVDRRRDEPVLSSSLKHRGRRPPA